MSFKNFFLNESSDKTIIKLTDASKAQELEQYLTNANISFSKSADDVFDIMSPKSVIAKLPFDAEFIDESANKVTWGDVSSSNLVITSGYNGTGAYGSWESNNDEFDAVYPDSRWPVDGKGLVNQAFIISSNGECLAIDKSKITKQKFIELVNNIAATNSLDAAYKIGFVDESEDTTTGYKISYLNEAINEVLQSAAAIPLSQINPVVAKKAVENGLQDGQIKDDQVTYKKATIPVNKLKGAQTEIIPEKAIQMALGMMLSQPLKIGGDLGSMISGDNYIMDGHHRWAATYLCDPKASVSGTQISLKGNLLVTALNVVTKGHFNRSGNPGKGDIKDFTSKVIKPILEKYAENGIPGQYPMQAAEVQARLGRVPGANGDYLKGIDIMSKNADALPKDIMPGAPARVDMPVINPEEVHKVADDIAKGKVDITKPYANESAKTYVSILDPYAHDKAFINNVRNLIKHIKTKAKEAKVKPDAAFIDNIVSANNDRYQFGGIIYNLHDYERATFNKELNTYINESFVNESFDQEEALQLYDEVVSILKSENKKINDSNIKDVLKSLDKLSAFEQMMSFVNEADAWNIGEDYPPYGTVTKVEKITSTKVKVEFDKKKTYTFEIDSNNSDNWVEMSNESSEYPANTKAWKPSTDEFEEFTRKFGNKGWYGSSNKAGDDIVLITDESLADKIKKEFEIDKFLNESKDFDSKDASAIIDIANQYATIPDSVSNVQFKTMQDLINTLYDYIPAKHKQAFDKAVAEYAKSAMINESIESDNIINDLQKLDAKLELYHHNTKAFSQHKAYDEIYAAFDFYKDDLIEKIIGYTGDRYKSVSVQVEYTDTTGIELVSDLADLSLNLASFAEANGYSDLKNISDSLSGLSAKLNYLLTLNEAASSYYVTCVDGSDMFWNSKVDEKLMFDRLEDAHTYGKSKRHGNEYWYCVYNAVTNSELLQERTKFVNGKFVTNYLK